MSELSRGFKRDTIQCIVNDVYAELTKRFPEKAHTDVSDAYDAYRKHARKLLDISIPELAEWIEGHTYIRRWPYIGLATDPVNAYLTCIADAKGPRILFSQYLNQTRNLSLGDFDYFEDVIKILSDRAGESWSSIDKEKQVYQPVLAKIEQLAGVREFTDEVFKKIYGDKDFTRIVLQDHASYLITYDVYDLYGKIPFPVQVKKKTGTRVDLIYGEKVTVSARLRTTTARISEKGVKVELTLRTDIVTKRSLAKYLYQF